MTSKDTHDPGWNDPPIFTYDKTAATQAVANKKGIFLNKRVAFPISSNMGNNAKMNSLSGMDLSKPPLMSQPPLMSEPSREKLETTPKKDIKMGSKERLEKIIKNLKIDTNYDEEIVKRIKIMEKMWTDGKLEDKVQHQVFELSEALSSGDIDAADHIQMALMVDYVSQCSSWMSGIRYLINLKKIDKQNGFSSMAE